MMSLRVRVVLLSVFSALLPGLFREASALTWQIDTVDGPGDVGSYASIALDGDGRPAVSYCAPATDDLKYARLVDDTWVVETVDAAGRTGWYTSLVFSSDGHPRIAYWDLTNSSLRYARWDGTAWAKETVDNSAYVGQCCSLALDSMSHPHISYYDYTNGDLRYARWNGSSWVIEVVDSGPSQLGAGLYTSLAIDDQDEPHISYADHSQGLLRYAAHSAGVWTLQTVDGGTPIGTSLALDANGVPHISFAYQFGQGSHLKYSVRNGPGDTWVNRIVQPGGQVGLYSSLELDSEGDPHILSWDLGHGIVQYDVYGDGTWTRDDVEGMGWTDQWCSLVLRGDDLPLAAYRSAGEQDLHVAAGSIPASIPPAALGRGGLAGLRVYPNPSRVGEQVRVSFSVTDEARLRLIDAAGRRVADLSTSAGGSPRWGRYSLPANLPCGLYFLQVEASGFEGVTRIVRVTD